MGELLNSLLGDTLVSSVFLNTLRSVKEKKGNRRLFGNKIRHLKKEEIKVLKTQGNIAHDWEQVYVTEGFKTGFIVKNTFSGECVLGVFDSIEVEVERKIVFHSGVYNSTIVRSEIGNDCLIYNAGLISNYIILDNSIIYQTNALIASSECTFGNGRKISVGNETGGREILSYAEIDISVAAAVAAKRGETEFQVAYNNFVTSYVTACSLPFGLVNSNSIVRYTGKVEDTYVGRGVTIDNAVLVQNCTVIGTPGEPTQISHGAYVRNSCLQWGSEVTSMAIVEDSVLTEHSHVERHGKVIESIIGPNTSIAEGEVTACLVGPFIGFHHQALLIATLWPEGKGNVGYGANIGSNHTSKAPDQELFCGEGVFFGSGVNVKYPSDFTEAPYTIIATAVDMLPQRVEFPFSLINSPSNVFKNVSPSYNEIFPGWVLLYNIYMIRRNEAKYKSRNKAKRSTFTFEVFRPEIIDKMIIGRERLLEVGIDKVLYTEKEVPGLGKNYMLEQSRKDGIQAYSFYIEYYALLGLQKRVAALLKNGKKRNISKIYKDKTDNAEWEYQREILFKEGLAKHGIIDNLKKLLSIQEQIAQSTQNSKERDDARGKRITRDHYQAHIPAIEDSFVKETWEETEKMKESIKMLIVNLSGK